MKSRNKKALVLALLAPAASYSGNVAMAVTNAEAVAMGTAVQMGEDAEVRHRPDDDTPRSYNGVAIGVASIAINDYLGGAGAIAIGEGATAVGADSIAIGANNSGQEGRTEGVRADHNSIAIGGGAVATGGSQEAYAVALGEAAEATADNSTAIGHVAIARGINSVALGDHTTVTENNVVGVGGRRVTQVAEGVNGTDAVNLNQLRAAIASVGGSGSGSYSGGGGFDGDLVGDLSVHGTGQIDKSLNVGGSTTTNGLTVNGTTNTSNLNVGGNTTTNSLTVKGDADINGNNNVHGNETVDGNSHTKGNEEVDKNLTVHGSETVDGNSHIKGTSEVDKDQTVHGNETIDKNLTVHGNETVDGNSHIKGNEEVDGNSRVHGNEEVDGDSRIHGNSVIDQDQTVYGDSDLKGNVRIEKDLVVEGNTQLGNDKTEDTLDVWAKTNLHGDTTIGDNADDKFVVNATSEFKADATFDENLHIKGNLETDGDSTTHGNSTIDGNSLVKGNSEINGDEWVHGNVTIDQNLHTKGDSETDGNSIVHGDSLVDGDLTVKGNTTLGDDKNKDVLDVNAKANLHGDVTIGDDAGDTLLVNSTSEFKAKATFDDDVHIKGNAEIDKNLDVHGNETVDGKLHVKDDSEFNGDISAHGNFGLDKNLTVGGDALVKGNQTVEKDLNVGGDIYGRSFNVGNERYIDKDGINANNHKIRNVADGEVSPNSLDAVNGRQLYDTRKSLTHGINQVGAQSAAMANLHPLEYNKGDKVSFSAAMGNYRDEAALAVGAFYRPDKQSMISVSGSMGNNDNMVGIGFSRSIGTPVEEETLDSEKAQKLTEELAETKEEVSVLKKAYENVTVAYNDLKKQMSDLIAAVKGEVKPEKVDETIVSETVIKQDVALREETKQSIVTLVAVEKAPTPRIDADGISVPQTESQSDAKKVDGSKQVNVVRADAKQSIAPWAAVKQTLTGQSDTVQPIVNTQGQRRNAIGF